MSNLYKGIFLIQNIIYISFVKFLFSLNLFYFKNFIKNYNNNLYNCRIYILTHGNQKRLKYLNFFFKFLKVTFIKKKDEKYFFVSKKKISLKKIKNALLILKKFVIYMYKKNFYLTEFNIKDLHFSLSNFKLKKTDISLISKHLAAWKSALNSPERFVIILEDDVIFKINSFQRLHNLLFNLPKNFDYICLSGGSLIKSSKNLKNYFKKNLFSVNPPLSRTTCGYIVSKKFLKKLLSNKIAFNFPIDVELNNFFAKNKASVYWTEPTILTHGSAQNYYQSINHQNL